MLRELAVRNLALIEDVRVELDMGFCAWTGETGAGKTLFLAAVGLLLGERGSTDLIRAGADELHITGRFVLNRPSLREAVETLLDRPFEDDELILSRRLTKAGRSYAYLNDQPTAVATLKRLGSTLVDMHSQHESQALLDPSYQLRLLDAYGGLAEQREEFTEAATRFRDSKRNCGRSKVIASSASANCRCSVSSATSWMPRNSSPISSMLWPPSARGSRMPSR